MEDIGEITLRWAKYAQSQFPKWELNELHNEAFVIAVSLIQKGRYNAEKAGLSTFLSFALPLDVRHRYSRMTGMRCLSNEDGKRVYRQTEVELDKIEEPQQEDIPMQFIETNSSVCDKWLKARLQGYKARELCKRGMTYQEQRNNAEELLREQQTKGRKG